MGPHNFQNRCYILAAIILGRTSGDIHLYLHLVLTCPRATLKLLILLIPLAKAAITTELPEVEQFEELGAGVIHRVKGSYW